MIITKKMIATFHMLTYPQAEKWLELKFINKILQYTYYKEFSEETYTGKLDRIAIDYIIKKPPVVVMIFNDGKKFEVEIDDFFETVKLLN